MSTFEGYSRERRRVLAEADDLEVVWNRARETGRSAAGLIGDQGADRSAVQAALDDVRARVTSSTIEIGVFGDVKRGKSTLLNALLGQEVSSMRVTPETAVPVWVERGDSHAQVLFADGTKRDYGDPTVARDMASQRERRRRREASETQVERIMQWVDSPWLSPGLRIVDTPGLDDPNLAEDFEALTLAELDRTAAAVLVLVVPPGLAGTEVKLVESLGRHRLDKLFVVCNFHTDAWEDEDVRAEVVQHVVATLQEVSPDVAAEQHVYQVHAKRGLKAILSGDSQGFEASGVERLREELERYLSSEVLESLVATADNRLSEASDLVRAQLVQRRSLLRDPTLLDNVRKQHEDDLRSARATLDHVVSEAERGLKALATKISAMLAAPYDAAIGSLGSVVTAQQAEDLFRKLEVQREAAASRASSALHEGLFSSEKSLRESLYSTFGTDGGLVLRSSTISEMESKLPASLTAPVALTRVDPGSVTSGAGLGAVGGAMIGGSLAGGVGIALVALGPVGWLIGAGVGLAAGALLGGGAGHAMSRNNVTDEAIRLIRKDLNDARGQARQAVTDVVSHASRVLTQEVRDQQASFFGDRAAELERVRAIVADRSGIEAAILEVDALLAGLKR